MSDTNPRPDPKPQRYRKKPVVIEAMQLAGTTGEIHAVYQWVEANTLGSFEPLGVIEGRVPCPASGVSIDPRDGRMMIATLEGPHHANLGDWIIRGVKGEFYPCKPDVFEVTYEPVAVIDCPDHRPVQHRDGKPPWCKTCGLTAYGVEPVGMLGDA